MSEEPKKCPIVDLMLHIIEMVGRSEMEQKVTGLFDTIQEKANLWGVPEEYHDTFIRAVLGTQNLGQILRGLLMITRSYEEMGLENPMIEPTVALTQALQMCFVQGFQTICSIVKDVPTKIVDEFMNDVDKEILELTG